MIRESVEFPLMEVGKGEVTSGGHYGGGGEGGRKLPQ